MTTKRHTVRRVLFLSRDPDWPWALGEFVYWSPARKTFTIQHRYDEPMTFVGIVSREPESPLKSAHILLLGDYYRLQP